MEREGFVFYRSFYDAIKGMDDATCVSCLRAICEYGLNGVEMADTPVAAAILTMARPTIDKNNQRYENGKRGGRPKNQQKPNDNQNETKPKPNESKAEPTETVPETVPETVTEKNSVRRTFTPPTLEEVKTYCGERQNGVDAEKFINFYESKGWMVGRNKMKDWKAAVRTWEGTQEGGKANGRGSNAKSEWTGYNGIEL